MNLELLGQVLLNKGFKTWFLYMFKAIERRPFIIELIHQEMFDYFESIYKGEKTRVCINIPPRSGKTVLSKYFVVYCLTKNPASNIIYTSYSQDLVNTISHEITSILQHPIYKALYSLNYIFEKQDAVAVNDFWFEFLKQQSNKEVYSSKRIVTKYGGTCIFTAIGSQILGFGAGTRNTNTFGGFLLMDDIQKSSTIRSKIIREKTLTYFEETLLSRLNSPNTPIINIQQRLHKEDLSHFLIHKYNYDALIKPLLDEQGNCLIKSQYTKERIEELKINNYVFMSQFQQNPISLGGNVIKKEYFQYYDINTTYNYKTIVIAADTAMKVKEHNDFSVFMVGGLTDNNNIHILDISRGKWEAPELLQEALRVWNKYKVNPVTGRLTRGLYIEDKTSGTGLIQTLKKNYNVPVVPISITSADGDKLTRVENILPTLYNHQVLLPNNEQYLFNKELLEECENFSRDMTHTHDDQIDTLVHLINSLLGNKQATLINYYMNHS